VLLWVKSFGKNSAQSTGETMLLLIKGIINHVILLDDKVVKEDVEEIISEAGGRHNKG